MTNAIDFSDVSALCRTWPGARVPVTTMTVCVRGVPIALYRWNGSPVLTGGGRVHHVAAAHACDVLEDYFGYRFPLDVCDGVDMRASYDSVRVEVARVARKRDLHETFGQSLYPLVPTVA